jgi:putative glutamine amidotransferase
MTSPVIGITTFSLEVPRPRSATNKAYTNAVSEALGAPILIPIGVDEDTLERIYSLLDGLLLPGGDDMSPKRYGEAPNPNLGEVDPERDELELRLAKWALEDGLPLLGICRGMQVLSVLGGGTLYQDLPTQQETSLSHDVPGFGREHLAHAISLEPGSRLARIMGCTVAQVNSFHHQGIRDMPSGFAVSARSSDGLVEGMEIPGDRFAVGVQCHPEEIWNKTAPEFAKLFTAFVEAAKDQSLSLKSSA